MNGQKRQPQQELEKNPRHFILHSCFSNTELDANLLYSFSLFTTAFITSEWKVSA